MNIFLRLCVYTINQCFQDNIYWLLVSKDYGYIRSTWYQISRKQKLTYPSSRPICRNFLSSLSASWCSRSSSMVTNTAPHSLDDDIVSSARNNQPSYLNFIFQTPVAWRQNYTEFLGNLFWNELLLWTRCLIAYTSSCGNTYEWGIYLMIIGHVLLTICLQLLVLLPLPPIEDVHSTSAC